MTNEQAYHYGAFRGWLDDNDLLGLSQLLRDMFWICWQDAIDREREDAL